MQKTFIPDAGGQINWITELETAFTTLTKRTTSMQNEKWVAKNQLSDATKILTALVAVRKHFEMRVTKINPNLELQQKSQKGAPIYCLGEINPPWMQRLCKDALICISRPKLMVAFLI